MQFIRRWKYQISFQWWLIHFGVCHVTQFCMKRWSTQKYSFSFQYRTCPVQWNINHHKSIDLVKHIPRKIGLYKSHMTLALQWRHNEPAGVSNHQPHDCLLTRLFRHRSKKISKLRVTGLCEGNSPVAGEFPAQRVSNAEKFPFDDVIMSTSWLSDAKWQERSGSIRA